MSTRHNAMTFTTSPGCFETGQYFGGPGNPYVEKNPSFSGSRNAHLEKCRAHAANVPGCQLVVSRVDNGDSQVFFFTRGGRKLASGDYANLLPHPAFKFEHIIKNDPRIGHTAVLCGMLARGILHQVGTLETVANTLERLRRRTRGVEEKEARDVKSRAILVVTTGDGRRQRQERHQMANEDLAGYHLRIVRRLEGNRTIDLEFRTEKMNRYFQMCTYYGYNNISVIESILAPYFADSESEF